MTMQDLESLQIILNNSINQLKSYYQARSLDFPSLTEPYTFDAAEALTSDAQVSEAISTITAASYQLLSTVRSPFISIIDAATAFHLSACLRVAERINAAEILREAGPAGLHVDVIASKCGLESTKLARIFRLLATHHFFREVKPDVFANNRISSAFDTGKSSEYIFSHPEDKHNATSGAAALVDHLTDEVFKATGCLYETLENPETGHSFRSDKAALQTAFNTDNSLFSWLEEPNNERRFARYGSTIRGTSLWNSPSAILEGFDWSSLTPDDLVVDVGGGNGMPSMFVARAYPSVRIVIQERPAVTEQGKAFWSEVYPEALESGRVSFQGHEFFNPQPQKNASVFILRTILHDWSDEECMPILTHLRQAATAGTKLLIGDHILPYACEDDANLSEIPGAQRTKAPSPLLANFGKSNATAYALDMSMQALLNGQERTLTHLIDLAARGGWRVISVRRLQGSCFGYLVVVPL